MVYLYTDRSRRKKIVINYLRKHPNTTYEDIKNLGIKLERIYEKDCVRNAYIDAGVPFSKALKKRSRNQMFKDIIVYIRNNPQATTIDIKRDTGVDVPKTFRTIKAAYKAAGVPYELKGNPIGVTVPEVHFRALKFEKRVLDFLESKGNIERKVRINRGIADAVLTLDNEKIVIEVKDYRNRKRKLNWHEYKQILRYMLNLQIKKGAIICNSNLEEFKKINIGNYSIFIIPWDGSTTW